MVKRILIIDGHPDPAPERLGHALADAYRKGAKSSQHEVLVLRVAELEFSLLRTQTDYEKGEPSQAIRQCQSMLDWATHVVILYPLWLGSMPALLKGLLEQMLRPGFAFSAQRLGRWPVKLQSGKSARIVVTMGMPAWLYRWYFRAQRAQPTKEYPALHRISPRPGNTDRWGRQPVAGTAAVVSATNAAPG